MPCEDCDRARRFSDWRRFDLKCPWCGARYLQTLKTWPAPRDMGGRTETTKERQAWRAQVLKDWSDFGHDAEALKKLASGDKLPIEPLEAPHEASREGGPQPAGDSRRAAQGRRTRREPGRRG